MINFFFCATLELCFKTHTWDLMVGCKVIYFSRGGVGGISKTHGDEGRVWIKFLKAKSSFLISIVCFPSSRSNHNLIKRTCVCVCVSDFPLEENWCEEFWTTKKKIVNWNSLFRLLYHLNRLMKHLILMSQERLIKKARVGGG